MKSVIRHITSLKVVALTVCAAFVINIQNVQAASLVIAEDVPPQTFDPTQSSQIRTWYTWQFVYEGLVKAELDGRIVPVIASEWSVDESNTVYDFTLRDGVKFSDGSPVVPEDVVFSFERLLDKGLPYAKSRFKTLASITKLGDNKVRFELKNPDAGFLLNLGSPFVVGSAILSKSWLQSHDPKSEMLGTGPFALVSYKPNNELVLKRNDHYWNKAGAAKVDELKVRYMPEQSAQIAGMMSGQIDLMFPSAESMLQLKNVTDITTVSVSSTNTVRLNINTNRWLIKYQDFWFVKNSGNQVYPSLHPTRKSINFFVQFLIKAEVVYVFLNALF